LSDCLKGISGIEKNSENNILFFNTGESNRPIAGKSRILFEPRLQEWKQPPRNKWNNKRAADDIREKWA
jgi:hypothetical protein